MEYITSRNNKTIIEAAKYKDKKHRDTDGVYCFEGRKLFLEALESGVGFISIFVTEKSYNTLKNILDRIDCRIYTVTDTVYDKLTFDKSPDGIFCIAKKAKIPKSRDGVTFILSSVRDPGNLGTCIRTARAFGVDDLILHDCADEYNPKVIRSSMGSFFKQCITHTEDIISTISYLTAKGYTVYPTALGKSSISLNEINIDKRTVFIVGNEGHGISPEIIDACPASVIIPMVGDTESLNVSVAAAILMWELSK